MNAITMEHWVQVASLGSLGPTGMLKKSKILGDVLGTDGRLVRPPIFDRDDLSNPTNPRYLPWRWRHLVIQPQY